MNDCVIYLLNQPHPYYYTSVFTVSSLTCSDVLCTVYIPSLQQFFYTCNISETGFKKEEECYTVF